MPAVEPIGHLRTHGLLMYICGYRQQQRRPVRSDEIPISYLLLQSQYRCSYVVRYTGLALTEYQDEAPTSIQVLFFEVEQLRKRHLLDWLDLVDTSDCKIQYVFVIAYMYIYIAVCMYICPRVVSNVYSLQICSSDDNDHLQLPRWNPLA